MIHALTFAINDEPGGLYTVLKVLSERGINVLAAVAMSGLATNTGIATLVCDRVDDATTVLKESKVRYNLHEAFVVGLPDEPGRLTHVARLLGEAAIDIRELYHTGFLSPGGLPVTILSLSDNARGIATLRAHGFEVIEEMPRGPISPVGMS